MKKIQLAALALVASLSMSAENTTKLRVWIGGEKKAEYTLTSVDSLTFYTPTTEEPLAGVFSVAVDKQVKFSKGNLQYTQSSDTWTFATQQYDMLGYANEENNALADKIDLFGWSGSTGTAKMGVSTSTENSDYSGDFVEWGKNISDSGTWRTLTNDEWTYLSETRANAANLMGLARINLDEAGTTYANGLILLPDNWIDTEVTFKSGFPRDYSIQAYADYQTFTLKQWATLEAAGAVFLPASGQRYGASIYDIQQHAYYWSATLVKQYETAYYFWFNGAKASTGPIGRMKGLLVRLVQDL